MDRGGLPPAVALGGGRRIGARAIRSVLRRPGLRERLALAMGAFVVSIGVGLTLLMEWRLAAGLRESAQQRLEYLARDLSSRIGEDLRLVEHQDVDVGETATEPGLPRPEQDP